MYKFIYKFIN